METHEGFSIREYVSRMRSVNVVKCWPFDEASSEESVQSLLPPITVKKFIWWLDGLQYLDSKSSKNVDNSKKKKKVQEKGESSLRSEDDVEDSAVDVGEGMGVVKVKSSRAKAKAPKKRSILEIFAVAPQVERVNSEEEEEENSVQEEDGFCYSKLSCHEEINWGLKGKRNEKRKDKKKKKTKKNKEIILSKLKKAKKMIKKFNNKQKRDDKMDQSVSNKENCFMFKLQDQDKATGNPNSSDTRENENDIRDRVSVHKKKPRLQHLHADKKTMACQAKRGILKNHTKAFSLQQSTKCILQEAVQVNHCGKQKADKHVSFLQKDNIFRLRRKPSSPLECFKLQKYCGSDKHNVHHAGSIGKDSTIEETSETEYVFNRIENMVDGRPASEEQHNKEEPFSRSVTSDRTLDGKNQHLFDIGLTDMPHDPKYTCPSGFSCLPHEAYYNSRKIKVITNSSSSTGGRLTEDLGTPGPRFPPVCFKDCLRTYNEPSVFHLSNLGKGANKMPQASTALNDAQPVQYETFPHLSPRELLETVCSRPDGYQTGNICGKRSINGVNEDFVGLPLNSQGELITLSSSAIGDFNQMIKSSTTAAPSISLSLPSNTLSKRIGKHSERRSWDCRTSSRDQLNQFSGEGYLKEKPFVVVPSRLDLTESRGDGQTNLDLELIKINDHSVHLENSLCKEGNRVQKCRGNEKILSTMRLMGKEFIVGEKGFQGFGDGHIWKDKQIIDELHFSNTSVSNVMMHDQNEPSLGKLRETLVVPPEITINHRSGSMYTFPHFDCQTSLMHQNGFVAREINPAEKVYPGLSPGTFSEVYNNESLFPEPFPSCYESQVFNLELPIPPAANQDSCPDVSSSDIQLINKQNLPHAPRSAIRFPFVHPDLERHVQSSWIQSTHGNRPPLFFDVSEKGMLIRNFQSYHNLACSHYPCVIPGTNHWTDSSVSAKPEAFCLYNPFSVGSTLQNSIGPASSPPTLLNQQSSMLRYPGVVPISSVRKRHGNQKKISERIKSRIGIRGLDHGRKAERQPSAVSNASFMPEKMPSLGFEQGSQCAITKSTTCVNFEDVQNVETALESCSATNKSKILMYDEYGDHQNEQRIYPWIDSYSSTARSGPNRLTAGAKHILKACQQIGHSSSTSTNSNIPLVATTTDFRFSGSENSAKIYKF
ncbi:hypothetical protein Pfo_013748 [Paulownia fortunei]|nr:hypothetical protein Pfo_013748 [Paulownia fortunei]